MDFLSRTCIIMLLLACVIFQSSAQEKNYTILEELPEGVLIGDLVKDLNLTFSPERTLSTPLQFGLVCRSGDLPLVRVEETTGGLYTTGARIDREKLCSGAYHATHCFYEVEVAVLPDEIFKLVKIRFLIEDVNDNSPLFPATVINISIPENTAINSRFPIPSAKDEDVGINGIQQYHLIKGLGVFGLDVIETPEGEKWPQLIVQKELDREERDTYVMKLKVEDGGSPPKSSTAILQVSVIDLNDNRPVFKETEVEVSIPENAPVGSSVYQLRATDADVGANAQIRYFFSDLINDLAKKLFDINNVTGLITVKEPLDREEAPIHKLMVAASDGGSLPARAMVIVNVTDVNDNLPVIDVRYIINTVNGTVYLSENAGLNTKIAVVTVIDKDADRNGRVTCFTENDVPFRLKPVFENQYLMETSSFLDYEAIKEYEVKLMASDAGKPPLNYTTSVIIKVKDENDNAPIFSQSSIGISVLENNAPGAELTKISATDADTGKNGEITYLIAGDRPSAFSLDGRTGILSAVEQLDREKKDKYTFTVTARDNGVPHLQSNATVTVTVLDQNDNSPTFTHSEYNFYVPENLPKHGTVGLITITDPDAGENGVITLTILNNNGSFIIDSINGVIRPNISFDREKQESYTFVVMATDGGRVPRSSSAKVTINVVDINDNKPVFIYPPTNYTFEFVPLATEIGTLLYVVMAIDEDTGMNAEIRYQIEEGNKKKLFEVEGASGNITLKSRFVPADQGLHKLLIKARDLGQPDSMNSKILLNLFVNDSLHNSSFVDELLRRNRGKSVIRNVEKTDVASTSSVDYIKYIIAIISGSMTAVLIIVIAAILRCRHFPRLKPGRKQNSEWVTPNPNNSETITLSANDNSGTNSVILNLVTFAESGTDDLDNDEEVTTSLDAVIDIEEDTMERYNWGTHSSTFKPDGPDLAQHYKATSPQPAFQIEPETPVHSKHHGIQELPVDNTFVMGCDSLSKCSSSSSDPYSISDCSCQGTIKTTATIHPRQAVHELGITDAALKDPNIITIRTYPLHLMPATRPRTPLREPSIQETAVDIWTSAQRKPEPKKPGKAQRRVTFHLPESSQESSSDRGPFEAEAGATASARLGYGRRDRSERATHSNRTEGDGNSDPETAAELNIQPTLEEASDNCTQECFILGHSDSCWMPAAVPQYQQPRSPEPVVTRHSSPAPHLITTTAMCHNPPEPQAAAICTTPPRALGQELGHGARAEARDAQGRVVVQDDSDQGRRCSPRALFCTAEHDDSIKVIPMTTFTPGQSSRGSPNIEEDPM